MEVGDGGRGWRSEQKTLAEAIAPDGRTPQYARHCALDPIRTREILTKPRCIQHTSTKRISTKRIMTHAPPRGALPRGALPHDSVARAPDSHQLLSAKHPQILPTQAAPSVSSERDGVARGVCRGAH